MNDAERYEMIKDKGEYRSYSENVRGRFSRESGENRGCAVYHKGLRSLPSVGSEALIS